MKMQSVVHFEMPAHDRVRMADFYKTVFGWKPIMMDKDMNDYVLVQTTETDDQGMPQRAGAINGGFYPVAEDCKEYPSLVIGIESMEESIKAIKAAGGTMLTEPVEIPGYGMYASFQDTEGNKVSMMEPVMEWKEKTKE